MLNPNDYKTLMKRNAYVEFINKWNQIETDYEQTRARILIYVPLVFVVGFIVFEVILGAATDWQNFACNGSVFGRGWLCWGD